MDGYFVVNDDGFLLHVAPAEDHHPLPPGFHIGFGVVDPSEVFKRHSEFTAAGLN